MTTCSKSKTSKKKNQKRKSQKSTLMRNSESHEKKVGEKVTVKEKRMATIEDLSLERLLDLKMVGAKNRKSIRNTSKSNLKQIWHRQLNSFHLSLPLM